MCALSRTELYININSDTLFLCRMTGKEGHPDEEQDEGNKSPVEKNVQPSFPKLTRKRRMAVAQVNSSPVETRVERGLVSRFKNKYKSWKLNRKRKKHNRNRENQEQDTDEESEPSEQQQEQEEQQDDDDDEWEEGENGGALGEKWRQDDEMEDEMEDEMTDKEDYDDDDEGEGWKKWRGVEGYRSRGGSRGKWKQGTKG